MSWFSTGLSQLTEKVQQASEKVSAAIPIDREMLAKLTLNTDEMIAERQQFGEEAKRKAEMKDMLADMFPWETKDPERDILVEECKEAILALSRNDDTFFGPYELPDLPVKEDDENKKKTKRGDGETEDEDEDEDGTEDEEGVKGSSKNRKPSEESLEKLAKLEPLPPLLGDFDLDAHVGLIQKLLKEDPQLAKIQSTLSGGGAREKVFWHNYFFHCAFTRYEAGLSIDEIWSYQPEETKQENTSSENVSDEAAGEETVVFDAAGTVEGEEGGKVSSEPAFPTADGTNASAAATTGNIVDPNVSGGGSGDLDFTPGGGAAGSATTDSSFNTDYELVDDGEDGSAVDAELDELEAEIARELEG